MLDQKERERNWLFFVLEQIEELESFTEGVDENDFLNSRLIEDACLMKLLVIGEYMSKLSSEFKEKYADINWRLLKAARNFYAHEYGDVVWPKVWGTLKTSIPELKGKIQNILEEISED